HCFCFVSFTTFNLLCRSLIIYENSVGLPVQIIGIETGLPEKAFLKLGNVVSFEINECFFKESQKSTSLSGALSNCLYLRELKDTSSFSADFRDTSSGWTVIMDGDLIK